MSQFHLSDEDEAPSVAPPSDSSKIPPAPQPTANVPAAKPPGTTPAVTSAPDKASEFHFFGDEPAQPVAPPTPPAQKAAPSAQGAPRPGQPTTAGPKPLQPRASGGAPAPPKPSPAATNTAATAASPFLATPEPTVNIMTAQQLGMEPTDGFSAGLVSISNSVRSALDSLESVATWLFRITLPIAILCLAYICAVVFMGGAKDPANPRFLDILRFSTYASMGLKWSLLACGISILVLAYGDRRYGAIIAGVGVALSFGVPLALKSLIGTNLITATISRDMRMVGVVLLGFGLFKAACDLLAFLMELPAKMRERHASVGAGRPIEAKQRQIARGANMLSPCWQLPFCRESVRKLCPAFLARKTCWKFGRGCYCDEEMIGRIVRGEPLEVITAPTKMSRQKPPCGNCYIYLEHQGYKFRILSPLALPATIALCYAVFPLYSKAFMAFNTNFNKFFGSLSFDVSTLTPDAIKADPASQAKAAEAAASAEVIAYWSQNLLAAVLGFLALIYVSKAIEWAIFKAKL